MRIHVHKTAVMSKGATHQGTTWTLLSPAVMLTPSTAARPLVRAPSPELHRMRATTSPEVCTTPLPSHQYRRIAVGTWGMSLNRALS
jgi:hypothetical protein